MDTSSTLLRQLRGPERTAAWERFVALYAPLLYYWARRVGCQEADAADLVQEVLTTLLRALPQFEYDRDKSFRSWLRTVTLNQWRQRQRRAAPLRFVGPNELDALHAPDDTAAFEEVEYRRHVVQQALAVLSPEFPPLTWRAFEQYVLANRNAAEVATELHISIGTVYAAKSRVLSRLRQELDGLLD